MLPPSMTFRQKTNKHITTCEQRSERYLLDSRWLLEDSDSEEDLNSTVEDALRFYDTQKDLIFCYPGFQSGKKQDASKDLARKGIEAFKAASKNGVNKPINGHLYFHNGKYYRYTENDPRYGAYDPHTETLGAELLEADEAEIKKTGGKGFITWMTEIRGYTAAQNKNTAFIFKNFSTLSSADMQQAIGRDRNNDPFRRYDGTISFSKQSISSWQPESGTPAGQCKKRGLG